MKKIALILLACLMLTACEKKTPQMEDQTQASRTVEVQDIELYKNAALDVIQGKDADVNVFTEEFKFDFADAIQSAEINNWYIFNNSLYIQTGTDQNNAYMFRFQFNQDNKIESYIKYTVEG